MHSQKGFMTSVSQKVSRADEIAIAGDTRGTQDGERGIEVGGSELASLGDMESLVESTHREKKDFDVEVPR